MKKILCIFPAYEIISEKIVGGKIELCKDILEAISKNHNIYLYDWKNNIQDSIQNVKNDKYSFKILDSKIFKNINYFHFIKHFLYFLFKINCRYSFLNPVTSVQLSLEYIKVVGILNDENFDIIFNTFTNSSFNNLIPLVKRKYPEIKIIFQFHHGKLHNHNYADHVIAQMSGIVHGVDNLKIIHPGTDLYKLSNKLNKKKEITFVGRLWKRKNCKDLIKAFLCNELKSYKLNIIGSGDELESLTQIAKGNKNIIFHGDINDKEKFKILARSSLFVAPSFDEGFGIVYIEALHAGTPIIGFSKSIDYIQSFFDKKIGFKHDSSSEDFIVLRKKMINSLKEDYDHTYISKTTERFFSKSYFIKQYQKFFERL